MYGYRKNKWNEIRKSIVNLATKESQFVVKERQIIEELLEKTDQEMIDLTFQYFNYLKQLQVLEHEKRQYSVKKLKLEKMLSERSEDILKFSNMVYFESNRSVCIKKIPQNNTQFVRCEKALRDNSVKTFFNDLEYSDFNLIEAYRIENSIKLSAFEHKLSKCENAVLKGLFSVIEWEQVPNMVVYGLSQKKSEEYYKENILQVPSSFLASCNLPKIVQPTLEQSQGMNLPFHTSIYSTSKFLKEKLENQTADTGQ